MRKNKLPYFSKELPKNIKFKAEKEFVFKLPDIIDEDGDDVDILFDYQKFRWLRFDKKTNSFKVKIKTTTKDDVGKYIIDLYLTDDY